VADGIIEKHEVHFQTRTGDVVVCEFVLQDLEKLFLVRDLFIERIFTVQLENVGEYDLLWSLEVVDLLGVPIDFKLGLD
jgi:hypothetical protein